MDGANIYELGRKLNVDSGFVYIASGSAVEFLDTLPENAASAIYRVRAALAADDDWSSLDGADRDWSAWDTLDLMWVLDCSDWLVSEEHEVIANRPPVISGKYSDMGTKYRGFSLSFSVSDPDPNNTVSFVVKLDGSIITQNNNARQGATYTVTITDDQVFSWAEGSSHTIAITAADNKGASSTRTYTFVAVEDLVTTAVFYVLRDGIPVAKLSNASNYADYMAVGTHTYTIRAVDRYDNFTDSNLVTITTSIHNAVVAGVDSPSHMLDMALRLDALPERTEAYSTIQEEIMYEGRMFPVLSGSRGRARTKNISLTDVTKENHQALRALVGSIVVYRDLYGELIIGYVKARDSGFIRMPLGQFETAINYTMQIVETDYQERITYD